VQTLRSKGRVPQHFYFYNPCGVAKETASQSVLTSGRVVDQERGNTMSDGEVKYPEWQGPLQEAILEFNREKLAEKLQQVEALVFERFQQLRQGTNGASERIALNDALNTLKILRQQKLDYPGWK
jgi:hypothetical protein